MKKLIIFLALFLLASNKIQAQTIAVDTILAGQYLSKAKNMLEYRQFDKFDSILIYSDAAAVIYTQNQDWKGLLSSLVCQIEVFARNSIEQNVLILYDSISRVSLQILNKDNVFEANALHNLGLCYHNQSKYDYALENYTKSLNIRLKIFGDKNLDVAQSYNSIGALYCDLSKYDDALFYYLKSYEIRKKILGDNDFKVAICLNNIGNVYKLKSDYKKALEYSFKALNVFLKTFGEKNLLVAISYSNIGSFYGDSYEYDKALDYQIKSIKILKELFGENNPELALSYMNIGVLYRYTMQIDNSLDFFGKALQILLDTYGEKNINVANCYGNIGLLYNRKEEYDKAIDYSLKSLKIREMLLGDYHLDVATSYSNIGNVYKNQKEYQNAIVNYQKAIDILKKLFGENHLGLAVNNANIGAICEEEFNYDQALDYYYKDLIITKNLIGQKNGSISVSYNNIGNIYAKKNDNLKALEFFQKSLVSNIKDFSDSLNVFANPSCNEFVEPIELLKSFLDKARIFELLASNLNESTGFQLNSYSYTASDLYLLALKNYQLCDTVIQLTRKKLSKKSDKITLGEKASSVYDLAIKFCARMLEISSNQRDNYKIAANYFSEQSKSVVLLQSIAEEEGMRYSGMPDSLLQKEHSLKVDISFYEKKLAEQLDSIVEVQYKGNLFKLNRGYEELISAMEKDFPNYYALKYSEKQPSLVEIQKLLNKKIALRSYFLSDSSLYIFTITKSNLDVKEVKGIIGLEDSIQVYRLSISGDPRFTDHYLSSGRYLYQNLFPEGNTIPKKVESLVIIPDGSLAFIPFESLPMGDITISKGTATQLQDTLRGFKKLDITNISGNFKDFPFLITRFNVSYSYSATLFYQNTLADKNKIKKGNPSWLAIAPVFSDKNEGSATPETIELQRRMKFYRIDTLSTRGTLLNGDYVNPLPGTEAEANSILKEFRVKGLKAEVLLRSETSEKEIKSGVLENYRILHFATHGFVNSEKPELSGILLAQDSTGGQDGILFSGELYNLKLNADLTVLSACETGLGKVRKGEGIIGLTRALLYAGSKNIIVSLWPVSDQSTSDLMIDFYRNLLKGKKNQSYSQWLREAKLKMIREGKYSNPFYWSPFILLGK